MGSMGKRRGRRTRADSPDHGDGRGWPTFRHNQWTWEGTFERSAALARGARLIRARGGRRTISNGDLVLPILVTCIGFVVLIAAFALALRTIT